MASSDLPPCRLLVRTKQAVTLYDTPEYNVDHTMAATASGTVLWPHPTSQMTVLPQGNAVLVLSSQGITKIDLTSMMETQLIGDTPKVQLLQPSPRGNYLTTWQRSTNNDNNKTNNNNSNLRIFDLTTLQLTASFVQKSPKHLLQFTHDEQYVFLTVNEQVRIYPTAHWNTNANDNNDPPRYVESFTVANLLSVSMPTNAASKSSSFPYPFITFSASTKDQPAKAAWHTYTGTTITTLASKSLFQAEEMTVQWNPQQGDAALLTLQTTVDTSGKSYYGSSQLFLCVANAIQGVDLPHAGPVHSVAWIPTSTSSQPPAFVVVAGTMPAQASLHHGKTGQATFLFGQAFHNHIECSPHGRFLLLGGFGNLAGKISVWDRYKQKVMVQHQVDAVVTVEWSPSSRTYMTATTSPRMNVGNQIRLFRYNGQELTGDCSWDNATLAPNNLLQVCFVPNPNIYSDRPQSPPTTVPTGGGGVVGVGTPTPVVTPPAPPTKYVPPSARNRSTAGSKSSSSSSLAERIRQEKQGSVQGATKVVAVATQPKSLVTGKVIPGMTSTSTTKTKSAVKREKAKLKKQQEDVKQQDDVEQPPPPPLQVKPPPPPQQQQQQQQAEQQQHVDPQGDADKRARKLRKTLKQIDDLKQQDPTTLNDDQKAKIESEGSLLAQLKELQL